MVGGRSGHQRALRPTPADRRAARRRELLARPGLLDSGRALRRRPGPAHGRAQARAVGKAATGALGTQFTDDDDLFLEHTLLVNSAEIIAHLCWAELGSCPGHAPVWRPVHAAGLYGVVDRDFFDWVLEVPGGDAFVTALARRLSRFDWSAVGARCIEGALRVGHYGRGSQGLGSTTRLTGWPTASFRGRDGPAEPAGP